MLNFAAGSVPVGKWSEEDDRDVRDPKKWPVGRNPVYKFMRDASSGAVDLPLAVQVVARPYQEEVCLAVMAIVERVMK